MKSLPIITVPNPDLWQKARKVTDFGPKLTKLAQEMAITMHESNGMGLAATQVGELIRLIAVEYIPEEKNESAIPLTFLVNPTITDSSKQTDVMNEGCLSIPGLELPVTRPTEVTVLAQDLQGNRVKIRAKDLFARILQHEIDHTNGILITNRAYPEIASLSGLRVLFMGTPTHTIPYIAALAASSANLVGVITETDKPVGRKQVLTAPPAKQIAQILDIPVFQFESLRSAKAQALFDELRPDLVLVVAYGQIIPASLLEKPRLGFLNVHYSLLPELRGPSPHQTAILEGKNQTGYTIFQLDEQVDTGPILAQKKVDILPTDTSAHLIDKMVGESIQTLFSVLPDYISGKRQLRTQPETGASYTNKFTKEDGRIDWQRSAEEIDRQIRAMEPWPAAYTDIAGQHLIIHQSHLVDKQLVIDIVQPAGKRPMHFRDYIRGNQNGLTFFQSTGKVKVD